MSRSVNAHPEGWIYKQFVYLPYLVLYPNISDINALDEIGGVWHKRTEKNKFGKKMPIEKPNPPFQTVETVNKPRVKSGYIQPLFPEDKWPDNYPKDWKNKLIWGDNKLVMSSLRI